MELPKRYNAKEIEKKWRTFWEKNKIFKFDPKSKKPIYSIDTPPPYASSGHLHIGHALHYTQFELIARYRRMRGFNVYFPPCFDNNGLPTEKFVEEKFKISKSNTTKAEFRKLCLKESRKVEKEYADRVFKELGHSYDWDLLYTTIDPEAQKVSQTSFVDLYKKKLVYRSEEPTLWCPHHQTALAQAEIEDVERSTTLSYIIFDAEDGKKLEIATTRPEFLPACVGVFVNPTDKRYKNLMGKKAIVPLFNLKVPILADKDVDMEFGTGIMMVCTFGDNADIEKWRRLKLPLIMIVTEDGKLNEKGGKYVGMKLDDAKKAIIEDLKKEGKIKKQEPLQQTVGTCWRCNKPVEFIVTKQWFIKTLDFKDELIKQGRKINWYPSFYRVRFEDWTKNLGWDWCISRQRFYGVPMPIWYCKKCNKVIVADKKDLPVDPTETKPKRKCKCGSNEFIPEEDVFDTWMTSSMTPEIAVRWLEDPKKFKNMFPMSLRPQAHDIIRTWAFYTILKAYHHFKEIPWKDIALGTYVLDSKGKGMHKSKGNVIWTHELLEKYNVDVVRYWVGTAKWGEDLPFQEKDFVAGQRFLTKLWNSARFCFMHLKDYDNKKTTLEIIDKWILTKLNGVIKIATEKWDKYDSSESKKNVELFFWNDFCNNYLEIVKDRLYNKKRSLKQKKSAQYTLYTVLLAILKLMAPITPFITEELYQVYFKKHEKTKSIHITQWPKIDVKDKKALDAGELAIYALQKSRQAKSDKNLSLKSPLKNLLIKGKISKEDFESIKADLIAAIQAENIAYEKLKADSKIDCEVEVDI